MAAKCAAPAPRAAMTLKQMPGLTTPSRPAAGTHPHKNLGKYLHAPKKGK